MDEDVLEVSAETGQEEELLNQCLVEGREQSAPWSSYPDDPLITREIDMQDGMNASGLPNPGQLCPEVVTTIYGLLTESHILAFEDFKDLEFLYD